METELLNFWQRMWSDFENMLTWNTNHVWILFSDFLFPTFRLKGCTCPGVEFIITVFLALRCNSSNECQQLKTNLFYFKSNIITTALRHVPVAENTRKQLWSRTNSPGIHLPVGLNAPVRNFLSSKNSILLFTNDYQSWTIIHPINPIPCLHPIFPPSHPSQPKRSVEECRCSIIPRSIHFLFPRFADCTTGG